MKGKTWVAGIGLGSPEYLTQKAIKAIEGIVAGYYLCLNVVRDLIQDKTILDGSIYLKDEVMEIR